MGRSRRSAWPDSRSPSQPSASTPTRGTSSSGPPRPARAGRQRVGRGHRPGLVALEELQRRLQVRVVQLDPLAAQPDQRDLQPGQLGQLGRVERLVAHGHVVPEVHQVAQAELRPGDRRARGALRPGGQLQPEAGLAHPVGQQHAEPGAGQQRPGLLEEPERARRVQLHPGRGGLAQRVLELAEEPGGGAEPGQQLLDRVAAGRRPGAGRRAQEPGPVPGPDVGGGDHQAGVVGGLQRELDPPGSGSARIPAPGLPPAGSASRKQVRTGPAGYLGAVPPRVQFRGQLGHLSLVLRRHHLEAGIGRGQGQHVSFGHRKARRGPAAPRGQQRGGQPGPRGGVGQRVEGAGQQRPRGLAARRPAGRGHRRGQVMGPLRVGAAEDGAPPGGVGLALVGEHGQHPAARGQVGGEAGHRGQVGQRPARGPPTSSGWPEPAEHRERGRGPEGEHRHPPAGQRHPTAPGRRTGPGEPGLQGLGPEEFRRGQRPAAERGQLQGQLVVDGLAGRVADRMAGILGPGPPGQQVGQLGGLARERMRSRQLDVVRCGRPAAARAAGPGPRPTGRARRAPRSRE